MKTINIKNCNCNVKIVKIVKIQISNNNYVIKCNYGCYFLGINNY